MAPSAETRVEQVLPRYRERYHGTARHFHDKLVRRLGVTLRYSWTKLRLS